MRQDPCWCCSPHDHEPPGFQARPRADLIEVDAIPEPNAVVVPAIERYGIKARRQAAHIQELAYPPPEQVEDADAQGAVARGPELELRLGADRVGNHSWRQCCRRLNVAEIQHIRLEQGTQ